MKKSVVLGIGVCIVIAFSSCKSSESAYKKAYEKAKQQELAQPQNANVTTEVAPVVSTQSAPKVVESSAAGVRNERVEVVSGNYGLKDYSIVCGSFGVKANAESLKDFLVREGYNPAIAFNADAAMYRVIVNTFDDRASASNARDAFKAKYTNRKDFQGAWLLYRIK
ncbi:SPOR domain-containing protein [Bacteroidaceae bacterium HV4-6-C5C]|jgi:Cell division protein|nr:SPOR domain-containing protein [Bacteroidaceae bacterium HV4-6-C5C]